MCTLAAHHGSSSECVVGLGFCTYAVVPTEAWGPLLPSGAEPAVQQGAVLLPLAGCAMMFGRLPATHYGTTSQWQQCPLQGWAVGPEVALFDR